MTRETLVPAIPDIRDDNIKEVLSAIKATLEVREGHLGDPLDQLATMRDLVALNVADTGGAGAVTNAGVRLPVGPILIAPNDGYNPATDFTTPPQPTGLRASGGFTNVYLEWDGAPYRNHGYTEIWRSQVDVLGSAVLIGTTIASVYADPANGNTTYYYWIRFVSSAGVVGPYNSTSGTPVTTAIDVAAIYPALADEIRNSQLFIDLGTRVGSVETQSSLSSDEIAFLKESRAQFDAMIAKNGSAILTTQKITATQATQITQLGTRVGTSESNITQLFTTTANQATSITQLSSTVGGNTTSIQTLTQTTNGLSGQYTVKIDNNGHVSGFGLASTTTTSGPTSAFIVRADRFAITGPNDSTDPLGTLTPTNVPFVVLTTPTVIGGITYPAGVWIKTAFIADATISSAKIASLTADKITTGTLTAAISVSTGQIYGGVSPGGIYPPGHSFFGTGFFLGQWGGVYQSFVGSPTKQILWDGTNLTVKGTIAATNATFQGLTITDNSGNVLLSSGGISGAYVTGLGSLAYQNSVSASNVSGLGTLATQNSVSAGQVSGLGSLATQSNVFVGSTVRFADGTVLNTGDFVNRLSQINSSNISTFIASAAIGDAYIGNLSASKINAGTLSANYIGTGSIAVGQVIQSGNFVAGSSGWYIGGNGNAEFNQITVRSGQVTGALLKVLGVPVSYSGIRYAISFGTPTISPNGPYYLNGNSDPWYLVWYGTMPAPETASHKIACAVSVSAVSNRGSNSSDLNMQVFLVISGSGTSFYGEVLTAVGASSPYSNTVTGAGVSTYTYSTPMAVAILVSGYVSDNTVGNYSGLFWGVR